MNVLFNSIVTIAIATQRMRSIQINPKKKVFLNLISLTIEMLFMLFLLHFNDDASYGLLRSVWPFYVELWVSPHSFRQEPDLACPKELLRDVAKMAAEWRNLPIKTLTEHNSTVQLVHGTFYNSRGKGCTFSATYCDLHMLVLSVKAQRIETGSEEVV